MNFKTQDLARVFCGCKKKLNNNNIEERAQHGVIIVPLFTEVYDGQSPITLLYKNHI